MKDQPLFEVDDTTTSYSPPRAARPRWVDQGRVQAPVPAIGAQVTAQHWYDPEAARAPSEDRGSPSPRAAAGPRRRSDRRPLLVAAIGVAVVSAIVAVIGTLGFLAAGGWLGDPARFGAVTASPSEAPTTIRQVTPPDAGRIAAEVGPAIVRVLVGPANGPAPTDTLTQAGTTAQVASGIVYHPAGFILTNRHVVCDAGTIVVILADGRTLAAQVYGLDSLTDLAILSVDASGLPAADIGDSGSLRTGQMSVVLGVSRERLEPTATSGVVSALGRDLVVADPCLDGERRSIRNVIQTDIQLGDGTTGGALVNAAGAVVGISTFDASGAGAVSFAIPINIAKPIMEQAVEGKPLSRPWMGITYTALNPEIAAAFGLPIDHGAWLRGAADGSLPAVVTGGPADAADLHEGDILTAIDDQRIDSAHSLDEILSQYRPEDLDPIEVSVLRDGEPIDRILTLGTR